MELIHILCITIIIINENAGGAFYCTIQYNIFVLGYTRRYYNIVRAQLQ